MNTEKIIKQQARDALHGNMSKLIFAAGFAALTMLTLEYLEYLAALFTGVADKEFDSVLDPMFIPYLAVSLLFTAAVLFASPLINGFLRMAAFTALEKDCDSTQVFRYFRDARLYFKTVLINLALYLMVSVPASLLDVGRYLRLAFPDLFDAGAGFTAERLLTVLTGLVSGLIGVLCYLLFAHYPLMRYALDDSISAADCVFLKTGFSFRHFGQALRLALSFAGWFALCFFVVPALYVLPYFAVASANSTRWLLEAQRNGGEL